MTQIVYTMGPEIHHHQWHNALIRGQLTRNINRFFSEMHDELVTALSEGICVEDSSWKEIGVKDSFIKVVCRTSNRVFVGLPMCRNADYCDLNERFTMDVVKGALVLKLFPAFLRPFIARFCTNVPTNIDEGIVHLGPAILERLGKHGELGDKWTDKPNDMLQWLIDNAPPHERSVRPVVLRILSVNFAAVHTTTTVLTQVMYHLAAYHQYVDPLREEVEAVVQEEGWTKSAIDKMYKIDSFVREVLRMSASSSSVNRKALKDFVLSDGTVIPAGSNVGAGSYLRHFDDAIYEDASVFNPWRFQCKRSDSENESGTKGLIVNSGPDFLPFGHGKHVCPGRFFAAVEMKAILAHVVVTYDVKMKEDGALPSSRWIFTALIPDQKAKVLFRRRQS